MRRSVSALMVLAVSGAACAKAENPGPPPRPAEEVAQKVAPAEARPQTTTEQQGFGEFVQRVEAYMQLHERLAGTLSPLPKEATPEQIDAHQRRLGALIKAERAGARRGDIFVPEAHKAIKAVLGRIFGGPQGKQLKSSIMDENPVDARVTLNGRYPSQVPLSTVPPQVLASLPKLPKALEYRFIGDRLILLDTRAYIIIDYIDKALP